SARIRKPEYNDDSLTFLRQHLALQVAINPEMLTARELYNILKLPSAVKIDYFSRRGIELIEIKLKEESQLDGMKLIELRKKYGVRLLVCVVRRGENVYIPDGNFELKSGDRIGITGSHSEIQKFLKSLGLLQKQAKSVIILGGSKTAFYLAKMLISSGVTVKIIEKNPDRCEELCDLLPKATIIQGDGAQQELLLEEGIRSVDAFVALTGMDEENILISIYAAANDVPKVVSKVNRRELANMAENLGLDTIVSPKLITSDILVRYARALENSMGSNVETLYSIMDGRAEALEFKIHPDSNIIGIPLKMLNIKDNIIIAGIIRGGKVIVPGGDDEIMENDKVIVIAADQRLNDIYDIIR
ncbi:MAG: Trk system potassium transporter TrkA, partial [Clostridia bacterium]|nr:Trk system potassium transporter TrkA [Clostridia bacterium]